MYTPCSRKRRYDDGDEDELEEENGDITLLKSEEKFHYVMRANNAKLLPLPDYIALENPFPGEPPYIKNRLRQAVISCI